ncbi:NAD(+) diphosphatase [Agromyces atrinae]|uniref:NAD(+) diphosphatase n=1 Tax=Agromyces atrinae TaxID=592376 RepID=UPI001F595C12|nr:NAD(+) diphosphatase [Agromyces atrinae]MCI2959187.1 NAD(+) diphosphatase [Agromyces atrinae]
MTTPPPLSRATIDRDAARRESESLWSDLDADASTRVMLLSRGRALLTERTEDIAPRLALLPVGGLPSSALRLYLGRDADGSPIEARIVSDDDAEAIEPEELRWAGLRTIASELSDRDAGLVTEALALANWHSTHTHCPRCGTPTDVIQGGWVRRCPADDSQHFPRTDPAVIVRVMDDAGRVLLGSNALWAANRYSLLAGFVEPGESLEAAVVREIAEEAGVVVGDVRYLGSQPWPFPASIMLGFEARIAAGTVPESATPDGVEILHLRWFSRDDIREAGDDVVLPGSSSIARWILEDWFGAPIEDDRW